MPLNLPVRASHEFLRKLAKDRLAALRAADPGAKLADAQLAVAREYGFRSWRALKAEVDRRRAPNVTEFTRACRDGDIITLRALLEKDPSLARERVASGATGLHLAARHPDALRLLLEHGGDPNARDEADNASPLHVAAAAGTLDSVRLLLDAGADVHGAGDLHDVGVIGWASRKGNDDVLALLLERGARHHIFSAMALGDLALVERLVEELPDCLSRRRSRFESGQTPLHAALAPPDGLGFLAGGPDYEMLALLIALGADLEAPDGRGRTAMQLALLRGDQKGIRMLTEAGAVQPPPPRAGSDVSVAAIAASVRKSDAMLRVPDMRSTVRWYRAVGFTLADHYEDGGELVFARVSLGVCDITLSPGATTGPVDVSLWLYTDRVEDVYRHFRALQPGTGQGAGSDGIEIRFDEDLYTPFYGGRQFSVRDPNGVPLVFWQPPWLTPAASAPAPSS